MSDFSPDFSTYTNYNPNSGVTSIIYGANVPLPNTELNEMQEIQRKNMKSLLNGLCEDGGILSLGNISCEESAETVKICISDSVFVVDGEIITVKNVCIDFIANASLYLGVKEVIVDHNSELKENGYVDGEEINNYLINPIIGTETSKRKAIVYNLFYETDDASYTYLKLGETEETLSRFKITAKFIMQSGNSTPYEDFKNHVQNLTDQQHLTKEEKENIKKQATESTAGISKIATNAEMQAGVIDDKMATPAGVLAAFNQFEGNILKDGSNKANGYMRHYLTIPKEIFDNPNTRYPYTGKFSNFNTAPNTGYWDVIYMPNVTDNGFGTQILIPSQTNALSTLKWRRANGNTWGSYMDFIPFATTDEMKQGTVNNKVTSPEGVNTAFSKFWENKLTSGSNVATGVMRYYSSIPKEVFDNPNIDYPYCGEIQNFNTAPDSSWWSVAYTPHKNRDGYGTQFLLPMVSTSNRVAKYRISSGTTWQSYIDFGPSPPTEYNIAFASPFASRGTSTYYKTAEGFVIVLIYANTSGSVSSGAVMFTLPLGFRPRASVCFGAVVDDTGRSDEAVRTGNIFVNPNGAVSIYTVGWGIGQLLKPVIIASLIFKAS